MFRLLPLSILLKFVISFVAKKNGDMVGFGFWFLFPHDIQLQQELNALYCREEIVDIRDEDNEET
jgi:hypothetical protein